VVGRTAGCAVCPRDPEALAAALEVALRLPGQMTGRSDIRLLDRTVVAHQVIAVYEGVIKRTVSEQAPSHSQRGAVVLRPRKVLMIEENSVVPLDTRVWWEALALRDHGFEVSIICPKGALGRPVFKEYRAPYEYREGIHIYRYELLEGSSPTAYIREYVAALLHTFWLSLRVLFRHGFDVIHVANPPDLFFPLGSFYHLLGKQFVFDQHDLAPELFQVAFSGRVHGVAATLIRPLLLTCERYSYRTADLVIAANEPFHRIAIQRGGCSPHKVVVVRNGPDLERMHPVAPERELKMGRRCLLIYVGVMGRQDGIENALHALHYLVHRRGRQDVALALLGGGSQFEALRALAHQLRLDEYVHFHGWSSHQDVLRYLSAGDIGLSPDPYNALNDASTMVKTMEYMAMGLPVVAFDLTETRFTAQEAALYATPNQVEEFADQIETLLDDEALRLGMGACGRQRIEEELNWQCSSEQLVRAYDRLVSWRSMPRKARPVSYPAGT
jgi:glycosyltransferase involved in cell wall biosynthesis